MPTSTTQSPTPEMMQDNIKRLGKMIQGIRVAMLTTLDPDGVLRSRPMATQEVEFDGRLWFFTGKQSGKVTAIQNEQHVNVAYASPDDNRYVSIAGRASVLRDEKKIRELWTPAMRAWFPKGVDDPDISLIAVDVESAEYWESPSSTIVHLVGFTKAMLTGRRYDASENHGRLDMHADKPSSPGTH